MSMMTRTANLRDLLENLFDSSSRSNTPHFALKRLYFTLPKLVLLQSAIEVKYISLLALLLHLEFKYFFTKVV